MLTHEKNDVNILTDMYDEVVNCWGQYGGEVLFFFLLLLL